MRILHQRVRDGELRLGPAARPTPTSTEVLVATSCSLVSVGTERAMRGMATAGLVAKARSRPDLVRQILEKAKADGPLHVLRGVRNRLDEQMPLGYSASGTVLEVGSATHGLVVGERVATGGAGHAELQVVRSLLAVPIPDTVTDADAAFTTIGAIALQGLRLADMQVGSRVCVVGLGLVGQLTVRLALASGFEVLGLDIDPWSVQMASSRCTAFEERGEETTEAVMAWSRGRGVDAVLVTAASTSSAPLLRAPAIARDRGTIVVVGDVGMAMERGPLYDKELTVRVARSYGPGRYERSYEDWAVDYPIGHVRWTEGRNMEAFLDLLASGRVEVSDLVTHRFRFEQAADAYRLIESKGEPYLGIQLTFDKRPDAPVEVDLRPRRSPTHSPGVALLGAGTYVRSTMLPAMSAAGFKHFVSIASAGGASATAMAERYRFEKVVCSIDQMVTDDRVDAIFIATPHASHAALVCAALNAGKHVFCEKPLALTVEELTTIHSVWRSSGAQLAVGFNRRHSPAVAVAMEALGSSGGPLTVSYRINAGRLPAKHWYNDRVQGGRLLGEVCHFIDLCSAVIGRAPDQVHAYGSATKEILLSDDVIVMLRYPDGSLATVSYGAGGHPSAPKERLEILGRGHAVVLDDFRSCSVDGTETWKGRQDKGHVATLQRFRRALQDPDKAMTITAIETSAATLAAALSLLDGQSRAMPSTAPG